MPTTLARTFAALSAINEAILYAKSPDELYQKVCDAGFSSGDFLAVAVFLVGPDGRRLRFAAGCGDDIQRLRSIEITTDAGTPEGSGVGGEAFRDQRLCVSNDYLNDPRSLAWREGAAKAHIGAAAALPLLCNGKSVGVLYVTRSEAGSLNEQMVSLFERMSANISYALDNFARETARQTSERATRRLNRMFGAISATNEAILRAKTEQELYQLVCDASVHGGKSLATIVLLREPGSHWMKPVASTGQNLELVTQARYSIDPENPYGKGISGEVFRTQKAVIEEDLASRTRGTPWEQANVNTGVAACVVAPLIKHGESVGVLLSFVSRSWAKDEEVVALLLRMAENVSFAIENFDREAEKASIAAERASRPHVCGAERHQRGDPARADAGRAVRPRLRGDGEGRQVHLGHHCARRPSCRAAARGRQLWAERRSGPHLQVLHLRPGAGGTRADRHCVPHAPALGQQRRVRRRPHCAVAGQRPPHRHRILRGVAAPEWRPGRGRVPVQFSGARYLHARVRRAVAQASGQRRLRAGEFRSRR
ncbi:GAF domain-containing protein [Bradyrhizobium diazoefficiens]